MDLHVSNIIFLWIAMGLMTSDVLNRDTCYYNSFEKCLSLPLNTTMGLNVYEK